jgi:hypothetical protein
MKNNPSREEFKALATNLKLEWRLRWAKEQHIRMSNDFVDRKIKYLEIISTQQPMPEQASYLPLGVKLVTNRGHPDWLPDDWLVAELVSGENLKATHVSPSGVAYTTKVLALRAIATEPIPSEDRRKEALRFAQIIKSGCSAHTRRPSLLHFADGQDINEEVGAAKVRHTSKGPRFVICGGNRMLGHTLRCILGGKEEGQASHTYWECRRCNTIWDRGDTAKIALLRPCHGNKGEGQTVEQRRLLTSQAKKAVQDALEPSLRFKRRCKGEGASSSSRAKGTGTDEARQVFGVTLQADIVQDIGADMVDVAISVRQQHCGA